MLGNLFDGDDDLHFKLFGLDSGHSNISARKQHHYEKVNPEVGDTCPLRRFLLFCGTRHIQSGTSEVREQCLERYGVEEMTGRRMVVIMKARTANMNGIGHEQDASGPGGLPRSCCSHYLDGIRLQDSSPPEFPLGALNFPATPRAAICALSSSGAVAAGRHLETSYRKQVTNSSPPRAVADTSPAPFAQKREHVSPSAATETPFAGGCVVDRVRRPTPRPGAARHIHSYSSTDSW